MDHRLIDGFRGLSVVLPPPFHTLLKTRAENPSFFVFGEIWNLSISAFQQNLHGYTVDHTIMSTANNEESSDTFSTQLSRERENNQHRTKQICSPRLTIMSTANNQESSDTFRAQLAS